MTIGGWRDTIFNKSQGYAHVNEHLAIVFHRASFFMYFTFFMWSMANLSTSIPALLSGDIKAFEDWFSFYIAPLALTSAIAVLYFPRLARIEMFSASALLGLATIFLIIVAIAAIEGNPGAQRNFWIDLSILFVPFARVWFIFSTLIHAAKGMDD